jgi:transketolase
MAHHNDIRDAYGVAIAELAQNDPRLVALVSDSRGSSRLETFAEKFPAQLIEVGIAEQNMIGIAAGLAKAGLRPWVSAIGNFLTMRAFEQIRTTVAHSGANVKLAGMSVGLAYPYLGGSHCALEDLALMRTIPGLDIMCPADYFQARAAILRAHESERPTYIRLGRQSASDIYADNCEVMPGGAHEIRSGTDVTLVACGAMVHECLAACEILARQGISVGLVNCYSIKPLDSELLLRVSNQSALLVTVEEHSLIGGLYGAICELMCARGKPRRMVGIGVPDVFAPVGRRSDALAKFGLFAECIASRCAAEVRAFSSQSG